MRGALPARLLVLFLACFGPASADPQQRLEITGAGEMEPVFLWTRDRCAEDDIPDAPLRAVRLDDDHVIAFATHEQNRAFLGPNLGALKRDCRIVFAGGHSDRPEDYSDRVWIASTWSEDGRDNLRSRPRRIPSPSAPGPLPFCDLRRVLVERDRPLALPRRRKELFARGRPPGCHDSELGRTSIRAIAAASMSRAIS